MFAGCLVGCYVVYLVLWVWFTLVAVACLVCGYFVVYACGAFACVVVV